MMATRVGDPTDSTTTPKWLDMAAADADLRVWTIAVAVAAAGEKISASTRTLAALTLRRTAFVGTFRNVANRDVNATRSNASIVPAMVVEMLTVNTVLLPGMFGG